MRRTRMLATAVWMGLFGPATATLAQDPLPQNPGAGTQSPGPLPQNPLPQNPGASGDGHAELRAGDAAFRKKDFAAAELHYRRAEAQAPSFRSAYNLGVTLGYLDRAKEAAQAFAQARERGEDRRQVGDAQFNGGVAHTEEEQLEASIKDYADALRTRPNDEEARLNLSHALRQLRRQQEQQQEQQQQSPQDKGNQQQQPPPPPPQQNQGQPPPPQNGEQDQPAPPQPPSEDPSDPGAPPPDHGEEDDREQPGNQPKPGEIPQDEAERLLQIAADQERRANEKLRHGSQERPRSGKDW